MHTYIRIYIHTYIRKYVWMYVCVLHTHTHTHTHTHYTQTGEHDCAPEEPGLPKGHRCLRSIHRHWQRHGVGAVLPAARRLPRCLEQSCRLRRPADPRPSARIGLAERVYSREKGSFIHNATHAEGAYKTKTLGSRLGSLY